MFLLENISAKHGCSHFTFENQPMKPFALILFWSCVSVSAVTLTIGHLTATISRVEIVSHSTSSVTLAWDAPTDASQVAGYKVYWGTNSRTYSFTNDAGTNFTTTISNLTSGMTYYFAVTDYDANEVESDWSDEMSLKMK